MTMIADAKVVSSTRTPEGAERRVLSHGGAMMVVHFSFPENLNAPLHRHPHEQTGYVVSGELELFMEGQQPVRLTAGCSYYVAPNVEHGVLTHAPTVLIDCFTPIREDFLEEAAHADD